MFVVGKELRQNAREGCRKYFLVLVNSLIQFVSSLPLVRWYKCLSQDLSLPRVLISNRRRYVTSLWPWTYLWRKERRGNGRWGGREERREDASWFYLVLYTFFFIVDVQDVTCLFTVAFLFYVVISVILVPVIFFFPLFSRYIFRLHFCFPCPLHLFLVCFIPLVIFLLISFCFTFSFHSLLYILFLSSFSHFFLVLLIFRFNNFMITFFFSSTWMSLFSLHPLYVSLWFFFPYSLSLLLLFHYCWLVYTYCFTEVWFWSVFSILSQHICTSLRIEHHMQY